MKHYFENLELQPCPLPIPTLVHPQASPGADSDRVSEVEHQKPARHPNTNQSGESFKI